MKYLIILILMVTISLCQGVIDIKPYLEDIKNGKVESVRENVTELKKLFPNSSEILLLEALTLNDGNKANNIYRSFTSKNFNNTIFQEISLFKLFQYNYALSNFSESDRYAKLLLANYPNSEYTKYFSTPAITKPKEIVKDIPPDKENVIVENKNTEVYLLQLGAFLDQTNAITLKNKSSKYGNTFIKESIKTNKTFYHVILEKEISKKDFQEFISNLEKEYKINVIILNSK